MVYSQGFNPRPRISLPIPRSVGMQSDAELLCVEIEDFEGSDCIELKKMLALELVDGIVLTSARVTESKKIPQATAVSYRFTVNDDFPEQGLKEKKSELLASEKLFVNRMAKKTGQLRSVDVRGYIDSVETSGREFTVRCSVSPSGTVKVGEIQSLFGLETENLAEPVLRTQVDWK